jgi:thiol:disulfide interchange protein/DsbC/DsbD-like thiol-disulfide interchange protein
MPHAFYERPTMRRMRSAPLLILVLLAILGWQIPARAAAPADELVKADLLVEPTSIAPGQTFWVGVRLRMKEHWHTYWRNPGDSGEATSIAWDLPHGFKAGPIQWPTPNRIPVGPLANYGYDGETTLLTEITAPADLAPSTQVPINAHVTWLVCEKECIPGEGRLSLTLPAAAARGTPPEASDGTRAAFDAARSMLPQSSPWPARMDVSQETLTLHAAAKGPKQDAIRSAQFFPFSETLIRHADPQTLAVSADGLSLKLPRSPLTIGTPKDARGVLVIDEAIGTGTVRHAFELGDVAIATAAPIGSPGVILQAALFALLGGLILNLMPCVFPVLSIKVLSLINHAGQSARQLRLHGLVYTAGVLVTFLGLAGVLLALRAGGAEIGWGFQLQSPITVAVIAYVLFAMGLSLSGVFHFGYSLQAVGGNLAHRTGLSGSFFAGALAVVVATPCTAPFMGTALGFALTQPAVVSLIVFLALGLGLALPFLLLTLAPQLVNRLPRPGSWMETLKQALAFPIYATVAWLMWVLGQQVGPSGLFAAMIGLVLVALGAWSFSIWQTSCTWGRRVAAAVAVASMVTTAVAVAGLQRDQVDASPATQAASAAGIEPFTQRRLDELRAENRPVFVNMTAAWCITCLVNERVALSTEAVKSAFAAGNIAYLKGDWTNRNPEITRILERHGRSGVPLYLLYAGGDEPVVLPQILTAATVLQEIDRMRDRSLQRRADFPTSAKE